MQNLDHTSDPVTLPDICSGFPALPDPLVDREHYLLHMTTILEGPNNMLILEGPEGIGKSVLSARFARSYSDRTFSLFTTGVSALARSPEYLLSVLCDQIHWFFNTTRMASDLNPEAFIRSACLQLQREAASTGRPFFFVLDGLLQLTTLDPSIVSLFLTDYLPVGIPGFKFLLTGDADALPASIRKAGSIKSWTPPPFALHETSVVLSEFNLPVETVKDLHNALGGIPGKIASLRRSLTSGLSRDHIEKQLPKTLGELFALEWQAVDGTNSIQHAVLAMIAHAYHDLSPDILAHALTVTTQDVHDSVSRLKFVQFEPKTNVLSFTSNQFRTFVANILHADRQSALSRLTDALMADVGNAGGFQQIPNYLRALDRGDDLLKLLTVETLTSVSREANSLRPILAALDIEVQIAASKADCPSTLRALGQRFVVGDLATRSFINAEIEACLAVGQHSKALILVQKALLKEDRLEGLAIILRHQAKSSPDPSLVAEVRRLAADVDFSTSPQRAASIGRNLIAIVPEVAIQLVEAANRSRQSHYMDAAYAALSFAAVNLEDRPDEGLRSSESISDQIKDASIRSIARAAAAIVAEYSSDELLTRCEQIEETAQCLYLLERWAVFNPKHQDAFKISKYAIDRLIKATALTVNCATIRRLATPLPHIAEHSSFEANTLVRAIDAQQVVLEKNGPSVEYVRIGLLLAEAEAAWNTSGAKTRIETLCYFVLGLDAEAQLEAFAWMKAMLVQDEYHRFDEIRGELEAFFIGQWEDVLTKMLASTAQHAEVLKRPVSALAVGDCQLARSVCVRANTRARQDELLKELLTGRHWKQLLQLGFDNVIDILGEINNFLVREDCLAYVLRALDRDEVNSLQSGWINVLKRALSITRAPAKAVGCAGALSICSRQTDPAFNEASGLFESNLQSTFPKINSAWDRIHVGYALVDILATRHKALALSLLAATAEIHHSSCVPDVRLASLLRDYVSLCGRAFVGLLPRKLDVEASYERLMKIITDIRII